MSTNERNELSVSATSVARETDSVTCQSLTASSVTFELEETSKLCFFCRRREDARFVPVHVYILCIRLYSDLYACLALLLLLLQLLLLLCPDTQSRPQRLPSINVHSVWSREATTQKRIPLSRYSITTANPMQFCIIYYCILMCGKCLN